MKHYKIIDHVFNKLWLISLFFLGGTIYAQNTIKPILQYELMGIGDTVFCVKTSPYNLQINIHKPCIILQYQGEEGRCWDLHLRNKLTITVSQEANTEYPPDRYILSSSYSEIKKKDRISWYGTVDGTIWRKDKIGYVRIYYYDVSPENKLFLDEIMDSMTISTSPLDV